MINCTSPIFTSSVTINATTTLVQFTLAAIPQGCLMNSRIIWDFFSQNFCMRLCTDHAHQSLIFSSLPKMEMSYSPSWTLISRARNVAVHQNTGELETPSAGGARELKPARRQKTMDGCQGVPSPYPAGAGPGMDRIFFPDSLPTRFATQEWALATFTPGTAPPGAARP